MLAQTEGVLSKVNKADAPLVKVQYALRLAERMVEEGKHAAAQDNSRLAQIQLSTYRAALSKEESDVVKALEEEITALMAKTANKDAAAKIRGFWERAKSLFHDQPGQAQVVAEGMDEATQKGQKPNEE